MSIVLILCLDWLVKYFVSIDSNDGINVVIDVNDIVNVLNDNEFVYIIKIILYSLFFILFKIVILINVW